MRLEAYSINKHEKAFIEMLLSNKMSKEYAYTIPKHGLIAFQGTTPIAAGFLRCVEGSYAIFDCYITNKNSEPCLRDEALNRITTKLLSWGKLHKQTKLLAFSLDNNTYLRSIRHGLTPVPYQFSEVTLCHS